MTRIDDIQKKNLKLRIKLANKNKYIKNLEERVLDIEKQITEYVKELHRTYQVAFLLEKDHIFDKYEFHEASKAEKEKKEVEFEVIKDKT